MSEKRVNNRKRKRLRVRFGLETPKRMAFTDDLSPKGLFITTSMPEKPGTILMLEIELSATETVKCQAQVRWARKIPSSLLRVATKGGMGVTLGRFSQGKELYQQAVEQLRY
ncbi:MAG: pilus assembly protein PilZ [Desulfuromonas sp.]|nr:MAG: pilus assembly protein PilZ [Desulfuromonas sp.]